MHKDNQLAGNIEASKLSIIIPVYNGELIISKTLDEYISYFSTEYQGDFEIVVIPNGCTDSTCDIARDYAARYSGVVYREFGEKIGKGGAVIEGFKLASGNVVSFVDVDGSTGPGELHKLVVKMGSHDGVIGSRHLAGSNILVKQPLSRRFASRGFNLVVRLLFNLRFNDTQCGAKVFKKSAIDEILPEMCTTNFAFDVELLHRLGKKGKKVREVPITWKDNFKSTLKMKHTVPTMFMAVIRIRLLDSPFAWFARRRVWGSIYKRF